MRMLFLLAVATTVFVAGDATTANRYRYFSVVRECVSEMSRAPMAPAEYIGRQLAPKVSPWENSCPVRSVQFTGV